MLVPEPASHAPLRIENSPETSSQEPDSPTDTPTPLNPRSPIPQNKVAVLHNTPESSRTVDLRNKLDYKLARFSTLAESAPIVGITLKEFLAILLNTRQLGRMTGTGKMDIQLVEADPSSIPAHLVRPGEYISEILWEGRKLVGIFMSGFTPDSGSTNKTTRVCVYGCLENGCHQWLSSTRCLPCRLLDFCHPHTLLPAASYTSPLPCRPLPRVLTS